MMNIKLLESLNNQLNREFYSAYLYLSMSNYTSRQGFVGFSKWLLAQAEEEKAHALDFYHYIKSRNEDVKLSDILTPPEKWDNPKHVFTEALNHEKLITKSIHNLVHIAQDDDDLATVSFLDKYVLEQTGEESAFQEIISRIEAFDNDKVALFLLDKELKERS